MTTQAERTRGFTLLELILSILIIATLVALLAGSLGDMRTRARQTVTASNLRTSGLILHLYANDWQDSWPAFAKPRPGASQIQTANGTLEIPAYFMSCMVWPRALADGYFDGNGQSPVVFDAEQVSEQRGVGGTPFVLSCSLLADPAFWSLATRAGPSQWRGVRRYEVTRTDKKALLVSPYAFVRPGPLRALGDNRGLFVSMCFVDGSARRLEGASILPGMFYGEGSEPGVLHSHDFFAGLHTIDGARGFDIR